MLNGPRVRIRKVDNDYFIDATKGMPLECHMSALGNLVIKRARDQIRIKSDEIEAFMTVLNTLLKEAEE